MYCKFCGKEIDQDSLFCKHCGADLSSERSASKALFKGIASLKSWFTSLSKRIQICLMVYFLWFWGAFVVCSLPDNNFFVVFPILAIIIPAALLMLWYAYSHKWFKQRRRKPKIETILSEDSDPEVENVVLKTYSLTEFAAENGKMQIQRNYDKNTCSYVVSYIFTNKGGKKTIVEPVEELSLLAAEEISNQKYVLCVNEYSDGVFRLERRNIQQRPHEE